jgi:hypothetical protein
VQRVVAVDPRFRRLGAGSALFAACMRFASAHPAVAMAVTARDDEAEAFASRRGFVAGARMQMWSLDLARAQLPANASAVGVQVTTGAERAIDLSEAAAASRALYDPRVTQRRSSRRWCSVAMASTRISRSWRASTSASSASHGCSAFLEPIGHSMDSLPSRPNIAVAGSLAR